ncbi:hypothetical protein EST38_g10811 [Candolleomyces aberdarensis]|uniref:Extracellular membrane protein CFEM domain-containing protein n=1 Tax=Candolleomyces aberdarensis TaxID=2316362 RepID=A0A4V1Q2G9_9AGAR|nr:hypothetical protein EST38_g10811 [Candolleomyces aberdarensis]
MARIFTFIVSLIAFYFAVVPVLAEAPAACAASCKAVDRIQECRSDDIDCTCAPQIISDATDCVKCLTDAGVDTSTVTGYGLIAGLGNLCKDFNVPVTAASSDTTTGGPAANAAHSSAVTHGLSFGVLGCALLYSFVAIYVQF